ncbi:MAG: phenylalanine--tRNA ligase subunit beta [Acidobacteria bacterium]|nr:phenylalanine--tRNA ligase subunit beta [Acidobacteriota bacterium]
MSWLRELVDVRLGNSGAGARGPADITELADALTMRGFEVVAVEPWPAADGDPPDAVLDLEITTNRPDCLSVFGIAREVGAMYGAELRLPKVEPDAAVLDASAAQLGNNDAPLSITIEDPALCPRYVGALADVEVGPSPRWLATRLEAAGVRPINNVVDVTNYVMLELGHPMHAFDHAKLSGPEIRVRRAAAGELIRTLDGVERTLQPEMLTIADAQRPQAVAGVMGGADSEVSDTTRTIVLEAAYFNPISVRRTSKRLTLSTDASFRFERGTDVTAPLTAIARARHLLGAIGAGRPRGAVVDCFPAPPDPIVVRLRHRRIGHLLGQKIEPAFVAPILSRLGFDPRAEGEGDSPTWLVTVPPFRVDVHREEDLIEEVARHHGYDQLPTTFPALTEPARAAGEWRARDQTVRRLLTGCGFSEAITYGFVEREAALAMHPDASDLVALSNPLSEKGAVLRPSLLPGLVDSLIHNRRRERQDIRLFEVGSRFRQSVGETPSLAVAITGAAIPPHWTGAGRTADLFDLTGALTRLAEGFGSHVAFESGTAPALVPGRTASIRLTCGNHTSAVGWVGQLDPGFANRRGLPGSQEVYVAEFDLRPLTLDAFARLRAAPVPRHPSVVRDLSLEVDDTLPASEVRDTIWASAGPTLVRVQEVDRYQGSGVASGAVSLSVRLTFRAGDRTLTDAEVHTATAEVVSALERSHHAKLR